MIDYLYGGMILISIVLIYFAIKQYNNTKALLDTGIQTAANVIDLIETRDDDGSSTYKPVFEYRDQTGSTITFKSKVSTRPAPYKIGDTVNIIYSEDGNVQKIISFWGLYRWTLILLCLASPLLIIGVGYLLYLRSSSI